MKTRSTGGRPSGRSHEAPVATVREKIERALRPKVEGALARLRSTQQAVKTAATDVRERFFGGGEGGSGLPQAAHEQWQSARGAAIDIGRYAVERIAGRGRPSEDFDRLLERLLLGSSDELIEMKKSLATSIVDEKRLAKMAEEQQAAAEDWERRVLLAAKSGDESLASSARAIMEQHRQAAEQLAADALEMNREVGALKRELRSFQQALEDARAARERMIRRAQAREAKERAAREVRRMRELVAILTAMSALEPGPGERDGTP